MVFDNDPQPLTPTIDYYNTDTLKEQMEKHFLVIRRIYDAT